MLNQPPFAAVAAIGLVRLQKHQVILDLGTIARAEFDGSVLRLRIHGQASPEVLDGDDAAGIWDLLNSVAVPTDQLKSIVPPAVQVTPEMLAGNLTGGMTVAPNDQQTAAGQAAGNDISGEIATPPLLSGTPQDPASAIAASPPLEIVQNNSSLTSSPPQVRVQMYQHRGTHNLRISELQFKELPPDVQKEFVLIPPIVATSSGA